MGAIPSVLIGRSGPRDRIAGARTGCESHLIILAGGQPGHSGVATADPQRAHRVCVGGAPGARRVLPSRGRLLPLGIAHKQSTEARVASRALAGPQPTGLKRPGLCNAEVASPQHEGLHGTNCGDDHVPAEHFYDTVDYYSLASAARSVTGGLACA
jgi:hypothetical protein